MDRYPPADVRRLLRREVGFGCPICRLPFLSYHHFNPPWRERQHHDPKGMIALCTHHHDAADAGAYSNEHLETLKASDHTVEGVEATFPWAEREILIRFGRCYIGGGRAILPVRRGEIVTLDRGENGLLELSLILEGQNGELLAMMEKNSWICDPAAVHDLEVNTGGTEIRIWHRPRDVGLHLRFSRLDEAALDRQLDNDARGSLRKLDDRLERWMNDLPTAQKDEIRAATRNLAPLIGILPGDLAEAYRAVKAAGTDVRAWAKRNCVDREGNVPLLTFENLVVWTEGRRIEIRNSNLYGDPVVIETELGNGFTAVFP